MYFFHEFLHLFIILISAGIGSAKMYSETNRMLNKPVKQAGTWDINHAERAVDGIPNIAGPTAHGTFCSQALYDWFMCDLLNVYLIDYVKLLSQDHTYYSNRLDNFIVGLSMDAYETGNVVRGTYPLCGQYPGAVGASNIVSLTCSKPVPVARHIIVQQPASPQYNHLTICEMVAYSIQGTKWYRVKDSYLGQSEVARRQVRSGLECMKTCVVMDACISVNWNKPAASKWKICILYSSILVGSLLPDPMWHYSYATY